jgi:hypothetical protein
MCCDSGERFQRDADNILYQQALERIKELESGIKKLISAMNEYEGKTDRRIAELEALLSEQIDLDEKWITPDKQPATDLKKGESVYTPDPDNNHTMLTGRYQRTEHSKYGKAKPGHPHGHLIILNKERFPGDSKMHWADHDKVYKEIEHAWPMSKKVNEAVETKIQMTMPLFIRVLEWAKEEAKDDVAIHELAERLAAINGVADMDDYSNLLEETLDEMTRQTLADYTVKAADELIKAVVAEADQERTARIPVKTRRGNRMCVKTAAGRPSWREVSSAGLRP